MEVKMKKLTIFVKYLISDDYEKTVEYTFVCNGGPCRV